MLVQDLGFRVWRGRWEVVVRVMCLFIVIVTVLKYCSAMPTSKPQKKKVPHYPPSILPPRFSL